jgi:hypothetical protein
MNADEELAWARTGNWKVIATSRPRLEPIQRESAHLCLLSRTNVFSLRPPSTPAAVDRAAPSRALEHHFRTLAQASAGRRSPSVAAAPGIAMGDGAVLGVTGEAEEVVARIDAASGSAAAIPVGAGRSDRLRRRRGLGSQQLRWDRRPNRPADEGGRGDDRGRHPAQPSRRR